MEVQGKFWGSTSPLFNKNNVEINRIAANKGGFSSVHKHKAKYNLFFVESGKLQIVTWKDPSGNPDTTELKHGDTCTVAPGLFHQFKVLEDCVAYEVYWTELDVNDIERKNSGGLINA